MFGKKSKLFLKDDEVAIPEVHVEEDASEIEEEEGEEIVYDTVAIPEIHIKK